MNVRFLLEALLDVQYIAAWYDRQQPGLGDRFADAVEQFAADRTTQPRLYGRVARAPAGREVREGMLQGFLFRVAYEVTATEVVILSVVHARRRTAAWRQRLGP